MHPSNLSNESIIALKNAFDWLCDGDAGAASALIYIKGTYKEWQKVFIWLRKNNLRGSRLVEFFQNESPDGGGYLLGIQHVMSRLEGRKFDTRAIKIDEIL